MEYFKNNRQMVSKDISLYYPLIIENIRDVIWIFNAKTLRFSFVSEPVYTSLGYLPEEMLYRTVKDICTFESFISFTKLLNNWIYKFESNGEDASPKNFEIDLIGKNEKIIRFEMTILLIPNKFGRIFEILSFLRDMSSQVEFQNHLMERDQQLLHQNREYLALNKNYLTLIKKLEDTNHYVLQYNENLLNSISEQLSILARYEDMQLMANIGSWEWNLKTDELWWSEQLYQIFEVSPENYVPQRKENLKFIHPEDVEQYNCELERCVETGNNIEHDYRIVTTSGKIKYCNCSGKVFYDNEKTPVRYIGTVMDITSRKLAEDSLKKMDDALKYIISKTAKRRGLEYFNALISALNFTLEADFSFIGISQPENEHIKTLAFYDKQQILPSREYEIQGSPFETVSDKLAHTFPRNVRQLFPEFKLLEELQIEGYSGVSLNFSSEKPMGLIVCLFKNPIEDISFCETILELFCERAINEYERLLFQQQLLQAREKAEQSDRFKTLFLQNMSHEIRTPMNAIVGFSELLSHNFRNKNKLIKFSQIIQQSGKDLLGLINDILDIARIESGQQTITIETCDINLLFEEMKVMFQVYKSQKRKEHIDLIFNSILDPQHSVIKTDKGKLRQVLINLINNAFKFTSKGKIEVGCIFSSDSEIQFYVADTGDGIPELQQKIIFERFTQLNKNYDKSHGGSGLGLSIVKGLVELLGGKIWVSSVVGKGSRFAFSFAVRPTSEKEISTTVNDLREEHFPPKKILIVEDDPNSLEYLQELLHGSGLKIFHVKSGEDAVTFLEKQFVDIVLMDICLPGADGYDITRILKKKCANIRIIAQTAYAMQDDRQKALDAGCDDYLSKPIAKDSLYTSLHEQLAI